MMKLSRLPFAALLLGTALTFTSCGSAGTYVKDRVLDFSDIVDVKYGFAVGLGAKVEATMYVGAGLGAAVYDGREWYGRRSVMRYDQNFLHWVLGGFDGSQEISDEGHDATDWYAVVLPINLSAIDHQAIPARLQRWRVGGELALPFASGGLYLNFGELADFFTGLAKFDIAGDDGVSPNAKYTTGFGTDRTPARGR